MDVKQPSAPVTATPTVVWRPNPGPQSSLLSCPVPVVLYGGARGGGKSDGLLGDWLAHAGRHGANAKGLVVRRTLVELDDLIERSHAIFGALGWSYNASKHEWRGPDGALLRMRYLDRDADAQRYQGHSYTWIGVDEVGNFPSPKPIDLLTGTLRSGAGVPCYLRLTGNPGGPGHGWVKRRYIDPHPEGFTPFFYEANKSPVEAVFIPSTLDDNPYLGVEYEHNIAAATNGDDALFEAWRFGNWDVFVGQMYSLTRGDQIIPNRLPTAYPPHAEWFATMDWGYVQGTYGLWYPDQERRIELVWEFYDEFTELHAKKAAHAIVEGHARTGWPLPKVIHADEQMWQRHGSMGVNLAEEFRAGLVEAVPQGVLVPEVLQAKHGPRSRETKVALIQKALAAGDARNSSGQLEPWARPPMTISERCKETIRVLQEIPRDPQNPNDVDPAYSDDHPHDMVGFAVASRPMAPSVITEPAKREGTASPVDRYLPKPAGPSAPKIGVRGGLRSYTRS